MIIHFQRMHLHNFMSFADSDINLNGNGYCLVCGENNNTEDLASSNGSGKSSIWEGLLWSLTGETIRGCKTVTRNGSDDGCYVELEFNIDKDSYKIIRSKDHKIYKTNLKIFINGEDKSGKGIRDGEKLLKEYLPELTSYLIGSVIILGQGLPQRFTNNTPAGRKEVLEKLSKSDFMIADIKDRISKRKSELDVELRRGEDDRLAKTSENKALELQKNYCEQTLRQIEAEDIDTLISIRKEKESAILTYTHKVEDNQNALTSLQEEVNNLQTQLNNINGEIAKVSSNTNTLHTECTKKYKDKIETLNNQINSVTVERNTVVSEIRRIENIKDVCPTCGQKLIGVEKPDTTELKSKYGKLQEVLTQYSTNLTAVKNEYETEYNNISVKAQQDSESFVRTGKEIQTELQNLNSQISSIRYAITTDNNSIMACNTEINKINAQISSHDTKLQETERMLTSLKENIEENNLYITNVNKNIDIVTQHVETVKKFDTLVKRDFRGYLLSNIIDFINKRAKVYCVDIFNTDRIDFALEGNNISISYLGKEYESLSGGEKQKIDLIVQFSLRDMLCSFLNFSSNVLVLDEVTDNLDITGCQRVINFISTRLDDVSSIYIISHRKDLDIPYDRQLIVEKSNDGISRVKDVVQ